MPIQIRLAILMPIQLRVWIQDWHQNNAIQNVNLSPSFTHFEKLGLNFFTFIHSNGRLKYISFHMSGKCVMILSILDSILKFSLKSKKYICLELISMGWIRIGMPWKPILIRILQNYGDLTLSGSGNIG